MASLPATRSAKPSSPLAEAFMRLISPSSASIFSAFLMETSSRSGLTGLTTKSTAPAPHGGDGRVDGAVRRLHDGRMLPRQDRMADSTAMPSVPGMTRSSRTRRDVARGVRLERGNRLVAAFGRRDSVAEALDGLFENTALSRVVDDDPAQRRILEETIKRFGYDVATAESGDKALAALKADTAGDISLVLLDLVMPGTDGMAVLSAMRSLPRKPPAIVQTAHGSIDAAITAMRAGAVDFVVKPVSPERLEVSIKNALKIEALQARSAA